MLSLVRSAEEYGCTRSSSNDAGLSADQACDSLAASECGKFDSCASALIKAVYGSVDSCKTTFKANCLKVVAAPGGGATPSAVAACNTAVGAVTCDDLWSSKPIDAWHVAGNLADGAA